MSICSMIMNIFKSTKNQPTMRNEEIKAASNVKVDLQSVVIPGPKSNQKQLVVRRSVNWPKGTPFSEKQAAENYFRLTERPCWKIETREQNSHIDIAGRSPDGAVENIQIVRLWESDVWRDLNTRGIVDQTYIDQEVTDLFGTTFKKKGDRRYPLDVRKTLTLLLTPTLLSTYRSL